MLADINILVIDDDPHLRSSLAVLMHGAGYSAITAAGAEDALERLKTKTFHLVFLDLNMPGRDGLSVLPEIRQKYPDLPVMILTGFATPESSNEATSLGVKDFLVKPIEPKEIIRRVREVLLASHAPRNIVNELEMMGIGWKP